MTAPCLLSNADARASSIRVVSERYYPVVLSLKERCGGQIFFVKRRSAYLSYKQDPESKRSLLVQTGSLQGSNSIDLVASFTDDKTVLAFAKHFCGIGEIEPLCRTSEDPFTVEGFCRRVLFESLMYDTQQVLPLYLVLRDAVDCIDSGARSSAFVVWDFRLIRTYYTCRPLLVDESKPGILNVEVITYLNEMVERTLHTKTIKNPALSDGLMSILYDHPITVPVLSLSCECDLMDLS